METTRPMPQGIVTFLFTDVEDSVQLWEFQTEAMRKSLRRHDTLLRRLIEAHNGVVFKTIGDEFCGAFQDADDAVGAALAAQLALHRELPSLRVRMALHTGEPECRDNDYFGPDVNRVARLLTAAHGGQVLVSEVTVAHVQGALRDDTYLRSLGVHRLRDLPVSEPIYQLQAPGLRSEFPPPNTEDVAFRRGLVRALSISATVLAVVLGLLGWSITEKRRADGNAERVTRMLTLEEAERGVNRLEEGDGQGLLDLIQARQNAETLPDLREATATLWAGWHQSLAGRLKDMVGHDRAVLDVKFSPDGRWLATASDDRTVRLWDTRDWSLARTLQHQAPVRTVIFSADSKRLVTIVENFAQLWDPATGRARSRPLHHDTLDSAAFRADGKLLATAGGGPVRLWNTETGHSTGRALQLDDPEASRYPFPELVGFGPPPANTLVTVTLQSVTFWNSTTGKREGIQLRHDQSLGALSALGFGTDGSVRVIASDRTVWIWDEAERHYRSDVLRHVGRVARLALNSDSSVLAAVGQGQRAVQLWNTTTGERSTPSLMHPDGVLQMVFGPRGTRLLITLSGGRLYFWDTGTGQPHTELPPPVGSMNATEANQVANQVAMSRDGRTLAIGAPDGTVQLWGVKASLLCQRLPIQSPTFCISLLNDGSSLATFSEEGLRLWPLDLDSASAPPTIVSGQTGGAFSADGEVLVKWTRKSVSLWQTRTGQMLARPLRLPQRIRFATLSRHGSLLATISPADTVQLWDAANLRARATPLRHRGPVQHLEFSPNDAVLATAAGESVWLWETKSGRLQVPPIRLNDTARWLAFSPDSRLLAVATDHGSAVTLWSTETGVPYQKPLPHRMPIRRICFSPDGERLATITDDNVVYLWSVASSRQEGRPMRHREEVIDVTFSPDGRRLATASLGGARLWDLATGQLVTRTLLPGEVVEELEFGPAGDILALRTSKSVYVWHLPPAPAGLPEMIRRTKAALGAEPGPSGSVEPLSWKKWRGLIRERK
jgi:WD40 repeat protein/class 3 adenylate cyclase